MYVAGETIKGIADCPSVGGNHPYATLFQFPQVWQQHITQAAMQPVQFLYNNILKVIQPRPDQPPFFGPLLKLGFLGSVNM